MGEQATQLCECENCTPIIGDSESADVLLFDGYCALCSGSVKFVNKRMRPEHHLCFIGLESDAGKAILSGLPKRMRSADSLVLIRNGKPYIRSAAAIRALLHLRAPWRWLFPALWLIPLPVRDLGYWCVAKSRHRYTRWKMNRS